jgi:hypothetical protein
VPPRQKQRRRGGSAAPLATAGGEAVEGDGTGEVHA